MTVMKSEPQVREGKAGGRCGENTPLLSHDLSYKCANKPSLGGHVSYVKVITPTHGEDQQVDPSSTTTTPQPQESCGRVTNTSNQRAYGQCIQSNPCCSVVRQGKQLNSMSSCCQKQLSSNLFENKMLCVELSSCFQKQLSSKVFQQKILWADSSSCLNENSSECIEKENSVDQVMPDRGMTAKIQPKLLQQNPSVCEGKARA